MKEKDELIKDTNNKHSKLNVKKQDSICSDQVVDSENKEKIRKLFMKKRPNGHIVLKQAENIEPDTPANSDKKHGSHSLAALHNFQNYHR